MAAGFNWINIQLDKKAGKQKISKQTPHGRGLSKI
jgi:hypothetical protein